MNTFMENPENPITEVSEIDVLVSEPLVSVVMITYNHEKYLDQAIEGVLSQNTDFPVELIIGEDCSTDSTRALALAYQSRYPDRIRVRFPERNLGVMPNFIATLEAARGKFIALCEGDDYWRDDCKLQKQVNLLESNPGISGVFHDCYRLNEKTLESNIRIGSMKIDPNPDMASLIREKNIPTASILYRKVKFSDRHVKLLKSVRQGDYMLSLIVAEHGPWRYLPEPMSVYRIHEGGVWSGDRHLNLLIADYEFYRLLLKDPIFNNYSHIISQKIKDCFLRMGLVYAREGRILRSIACYIKSIGDKHEIAQSKLSQKKYWKEIIRAVSAKLSVDGLMHKIWARIGRVMK